MKIEDEFSPEELKKLEGMWQFEARDLGPCICGGKILGTVKEPLAILHSDPPCKEYMEMEPVPFLALINQSRKPQ